MIATVISLIFFVRVLAVLLRFLPRLDGLGRLGLPALICLVPLALLLVAANIFPAGQPNGSGRNYHLGETVSVDGRWAVMVQLGHPETQLAAPEDGTFCVELDVTLRNLTNQSLSLGDDQFTLYDGQANSIDTQCSVGANGLSVSGLAPGRTLSGMIAFAVPLGMSQFYLAFQPDPQNDGSVVQSIWQILVTQPAE